MLILTQLQYSIKTSQFYVKSYAKNIFFYYTELEKPNVKN